MKKEYSYADFRKIAKAGERDLDRLEVGDVLIRDNDTMKVLLILNTVVVTTEHGEDEEVGCYTWTVSELKKNSWKLKQEEEIEELTVAQLEKERGHKVKIVKE